MKKLTVFVTLIFGVLSIANAQSQKGKGQKKGNNQKEYHNHSSKDSTGKKEHDHEKNEGKSVEQRATGKGEFWKSKLGLSEEEKTKFVEAKKTQLTKIQQLRQTKPVDKVALKATQTEFETSVKSAFTPEHYDAWIKAKAEQKEKHKENKGYKGEKGEREKSEYKGKKKPEHSKEKTKESESEDSEENDD